MVVANPSPPPFSPFHLNLFISENSRGGGEDLPLPYSIRPCLCIAGRLLEERNVYSGNSVRSPTVVIAGKYYNKEAITCN